MEARAARANCLFYFDNIKDKFSVNLILFPIGRQPSRALRYKMRSNTNDCLGEHLSLVDCHVNFNEN